MTGKDRSYDPLPINESSFNKTAEELKEMLNIIKATMGVQIEWMEVRAKLNKTLYDEHIKAGFSKQDALEIVKVKGV